LTFALEGVKVLDLTHHIAGPYCTKLFADYGADVVKVERPDGGDPARRMGPFFHDDPHSEKSGLFLHLNTNKRSVTLNLKTTAGRGLLLDLVRDADILVENFSPRVMPSLGLDYATIEAVNPRLVMASISNYGATGPYRDYRMSEMTLYAMGGTMHATGLPEREPLKLALTVEQFYAGKVIAAAVMGALFGASRTGAGQHLDLALFEIMVGNQDRGAQANTIYKYNGNVPYRRGADSVRNILPVGVYPASDGYVQLFALQPRVWDRVCRMIDRPDLIDDPHFTEPKQFFGNMEVKAEVDALVLEWLLQHTKRDVMEKAQSVGYFCGALNSMEDVFNDPHLAARGYFATVDHPYTGPLRYPGAPFRMEHADWRAGRAPLLGEHTYEVLTERLGLSGPDLARLRAQGAI